MCVMIFQCVGGECCNVVVMIFTCVGVSVYMCVMMFSVLRE